MTDLDRHVSQPGRDKLVKQVRASFNKKRPVTSWEKNNTLDC